MCVEKGTVTVAGLTRSSDFPTTVGAFDRTHGGVYNAFVSRLRIAFYADRYEVSLQSGGTQNLQLDAGAAHAFKAYAIFGSMTGTDPGVVLSGIRIPLNVDPYTDVTLTAAPPWFIGFRSVLDNHGSSTAAIQIPALPTLPPIAVHHAYIVFDNTGKIHMASNAVPLRLK